MPLFERDRLCPFRLVLIQIWKNLKAATRRDRNYLAIDGHPTRGLIRLHCGRICFWKMRVSLRSLPFDLAVPVGFLLFFHEPIYQHTGDTNLAR